MKKAPWIIIALFCAMPMVASAQIPLLLKDNVVSSLRVETLDPETLRLKQVVAQIVSNREDELRLEQQGQIRLSLLMISIVALGRLAFDRYRRHH